jgi:hypothetical protein
MAGSNDTPIVTATVTARETRFVPLAAIAVPFKPTPKPEKPVAAPLNPADSDGTPPLDLPPESATPPPLDTTSKTKPASSPQSVPPSFDKRIADRDPGPAPLATASPQTTPLAAVAAPPPLVQGIATTIAAVLDGTPAPVGAPAIVSPPVELASTPVRIVAVTLDTAEHGALDVRMSLSGDALTVHLRCERRETAESLRNDSAALGDLLRSHGYDATIVRVETRHTAATQPDMARNDFLSGNGGGNNNALSGQPGGNRDAPASGQQPRTPPQSPFDPGLLRRSDDTPVPDRGARGLYI